MSADSRNPGAPKGPSYRDGLNEVRIRLRNILDLVQKLESSISHTPREDSTRMNPPDDMDLDSLIRNLDSDSIEITNRLATIADRL